MWFTYFAYFACILVVFLCDSFKAKKLWLHKESIKLLHRYDLSQGKRAAKDLYHTVVFVRKQKNLDKLESILHAVSDPESPEYGNYLTKEDVAKITGDPEAVTEIVNYLKRNGVTNSTVSTYGDYISADASVKTWETILKCEFYEFRHKVSNSPPFVRSLKYFLHHSLADHVEAVLNTVQLPSPHIVATPMTTTTDPITAMGGFVTPALLRSFYHIDDTVGNNLTSQGVYGNLQQSVSPSDLALFQLMFQIPDQPILTGTGGHVSEDACSLSVAYCMEANLDAQYITAIGQKVPTTYYYWTGLDIWLGFVTRMANMDNPPDVLSISYGSYEFFMSKVYLDAFNVEVMKLAVVGTTVVAASGDDGVAGFVARMLGAAYCGYLPMFPASSPYVTTVGGTMGPETGDPEVACSTKAGGWITTGGGFSSIFPVQPWQARAISGYIDHVALAELKPEVGYALGKRGYPDVAALADKYIIAAHGSFFQISGTSASTPVVAGMISLVNSARRAAGKPSLGFLNPALYALHALFVNDIIEGENNCLAAGAQCCAEGFYAAVGWDPVTGLGSIDFAKFLRAMMEVEVPVVDKGNVSELMHRLERAAENTMKTTHTDLHNVASPWWVVSAHDVLLYMSVMLIMLTVIVLLSIIAYKATFRSEYILLP